MSPRRTLALALVGLAAGVVPAPASAQEAATARSTPLREHAGITVLSRWDGTAYRLAVRRGGDGIDDVAGVPPQATPFDADVGPDSRGRTTIAFSRCTPGCDLLLVRPSGGTPRPVTTANTAGADETDPTIWRGRIAFARRAGDRDVPYTRMLTWPRSRASTRLAELPRERCLSVDAPRCRPVRRQRLQALELWGRWVGQSWTYEANGAGGFRQNEMRLTTVDRRITRQLAFHVTGLSGQRLLAPSFAGGAIAWYLGCNSDTGGCRNAGGATRYGIRLGTYARDVETTRLGGWAWDGQFQHRSVESPRGCTVEESEVAPPGGAECPLVRAPQPDWERISAPRPVR